MKDYFWVKHVHQCLKNNMNRLNYHFTRIRHPLYFQWEDETIITFFFFFLWRRCLGSFKAVVELSISIDISGHKTMGDSSFIYDRILTQDSCFLRWILDQHTNPSRLKRKIKLEKLNTSRTIEVSIEREKSLWI